MFSLILNSVEEKTLSSLVLYLAVLATVQRKIYSNYPFSVVWLLTQHAGPFSALVPLS